MKLSMFLRCLLSCAVFQAIAANEEDKASQAAAAVNCQQKDVEVSDENPQHKLCAPTNCVACSVEGSNLTLFCNWEKMTFDLTLISPALTNPPSAVITTKNLPTEEDLRGKNYQRSCPPNTGNINYTNHGTNKPTLPVLSFLNSRPLIRSGILSYATSFKLTEYFLDPTDDCEYYSSKTRTVNLVCHARPLPAEEILPPPLHSECFCTPCEHIVPPFDCECKCKNNTFVITAKPADPSVTHGLQRDISWELMNVESQPEANSALTQGLFPNFANICPKSESSRHIRPDYISITVPQHSFVGYPNSAVLVTCKQRYCVRSNTQTGDSTYPVCSNPLPPGCS